MILATNPFNRPIAILQADDLARACGLPPARQRMARRLRDHSGGTQASVQRGQGMEYWTSRRYQVGDDVRLMDWRVTARTGQPHSKVYREEQRRTLWLMLDTSTSMDFGSRCTTKRIQAARLASWLAASALSDGYRVGLYQFTTQQADCLAPHGGGRALSRLLQYLVAKKPLAPQLLTRTVQDWQARITPGSRLIILSDGYPLANLPDQSLRLLAQRHQTSWLRVLDILEWWAPPPGRYGLWQGGQRRVLALANQAQQDEFSRQLQQPQQRLAQRLQGLGIDMMPAFTHQVELGRITL